jgi:hypothetical protein
MAAVTPMLAAGAAMEGAIRMRVAAAETQAGIPTPAAAAEMRATAAEGIEAAATPGVAANQKMAARAAAVGEIQA